MLNLKNQLFHNLKYDLNASATISMYIRYTLYGIYL